MGKQSISRRSLLAAAAGVGPALMLPAGPADGGRTAVADTLSLMRTYEPPPKDLDLRTAPAAVLRRHGVPGRPDPRRQPGLARLYNGVLDREPAVVRAELAVAPELGGQHRGLAYGPQYWGGVMRSRNVGTDFSGFATTVSAQWQVPEVLTVDPAGRQQLNIAFWIGLNDGSEQVLQAGIAAVVSPGWFGTDVNYFAWTEWWTRQYADPAVRVTNFPVTAGDTVAMTVCAPQPDYGFVTMTNVTRNQGTSVGIQARPGVTSVGGSVEWVLESSAPSPLLPAFRPITFTDCYGGSSTESFHLLPDPTVVAITSTRRKTLTATQILSSTSAQVSWLDFD